MGVTYKAMDTNLRIPVALKVIASAHLNSEIARQRFVREAAVGLPGCAIRTSPRCTISARRGTRISMRWSSSMGKPSMP
jgi:hypothetical protein